MTLTQFDSSTGDSQSDRCGNRPSSSPSIAPVTSGVAPWFSCLAYPLGRYFVLPFYFGRIDVTGRENLPTNGPVILAATHRSRWDSFMVPYAAGKDITGRDLRFMVSAYEVSGLQGWVIRRFGGFPVDTVQPSLSSMRHTIELLRNGETLVIFPEGNIYRESTIQPLKAGLGRMALQAESGQPGLGIKIVPINIRYSQPIPSWGCNIQITIGSPLEVSNYTTGSTKRNAQKLMIDLETALKQLNGEAIAANNFKLDELV